MVLDERLRPAWAALTLVVPLGIAAVLAWAAGPVSGGWLQAVLLLAVAAAVSAGGPVATAVLRSADPTSASVAGGPSDPEVLRGGAWIGVLERVAIAGTLLAGWPEGLAVVLAVKGLGRFAELRAPAAAERFILGTLASALWAVGCVGVVVLLRR
nr:hypothetical protein [Petropleomorpha daqingensis]